MHFTSYCVCRITFFCKLSYHVKLFGCSRFCATFWYWQPPCQPNLKLWRNWHWPIYYPIYSLITALLPDAMRDYSTKKLPSPSAHRPWLSLMCSSNLYQSPPSKRRPPAPNIEYAGRSSPLWPSSATSLAASTARKYSQWLQYASIKCDLITTASPLYPGRVF